MGYVKGAAGMNIGKTGQVVGCVPHSKPCISVWHRLGATAFQQLYAKYAHAKTARIFIESMIAPME